MIQLFRSTFLLFLLVLPTALPAQDSICYRVGTDATLSTGQTAPWWLTANRYGMYRLAPFSGTLYAGVGKDLNRQGNWYDYAFQASGVFNASQEGVRAHLHELYAAFRGFGFLDVVVGARQEHIGSQDSILSSGGFLFSHNARPMPKVTVGIEQYANVPFTGGYVQIKGALVHGWMDELFGDAPTFLHHKYMYVKVGGRLPVNLHYGLHHVAQWGGYSTTYGRQPASFGDFLRVFAGKSGTDPDNTNDYNNAVGNHILSQDLRMDVEVAGFTLSAYWQNLTEDPPVRFIFNTMNVSDGLWGVTLKSNRVPFVTGILYEFLNTTDQSGPFHDKDGMIYGGADNYFFNSIYRSGWTYRGQTIGTPFITPPLSSDTEKSKAYNNRVKVHHAGIYGQAYGVHYRALASFSRSYGTYFDPFGQVMRCTSLLLEMRRHMPRWWGIEIGCALSADIGEIPVAETPYVTDGASNVSTGGNTFGVRLSVRKTGTLFKLSR